MSETFPTQIDRDRTKLTKPLMDRMDPAIGEASTVMGGMLTELLRRSLRGGVMQIGEELHSFVAEKVDAAITDRTPAIEQNAAEVAENTARAAATEVAKEEVVALEQRTKEADQQLAFQLEETEKRVVEATHAELTQQIEAVTERTRRGTAFWTEKLKAMEAVTAQLQEELTTRLSGIVTEWTTKLIEEQAAAKQRAASLMRQVEQDVEESQSRLNVKIDELLTANEALAERIAELEKPRGLRALFAKLFGRRQKKVVKQVAKEVAEAVEIEES